LGSQAPEAKSELTPMELAWRVSAVIPAYNRSHCIGRAVSSVLAQSVPACEILIVDDGSSDDLAGAVAKFGDQVRLIVHDRNRGAAAARNTGLRAAACELVAFLDSDDVWKPEKIAEQIAFMERLDLQASCTGFEVVNPDTNRARVAWRPYPETLAVADLVWGCYTSPGSTLVVRREVLEECGGYDVRYARYEDWDMMLRLATTSPKGIGFLREPLATVHLGSAPPPDCCYASLELLKRDHDALLRNQDPKLSRNFRSGVAFNRASVFAGQGRWGPACLELGRAIFLAPIGNWPFRVILSEWLHSLNKGA
jgi:glycosyltransferase involved in cell wall biosynthesis